MSQKIIGIVGFIGSGKGTVGNYLVNNYKFKSVSFASSLKDVTAAIFGWPRTLLEGDTEESREWREQVDTYWSKKLGCQITPRQALQQLGTDVIRNNFFDNIWVASLERKIMQEPGNIVVTDARYPNEIEMIRKMNGELWWVQRGDLPQWYQCALHLPLNMPSAWPSVHSSEYIWVSCGPFSLIKNDGSLEDLYKQVVDALI
jgi:hypothetical protein